MAAPDSPGGAVTVAPTGTLPEYVDWALAELGGSGPYQQRANVLLAAPWALCGAQTMVHVFVSLPAARQTRCADAGSTCVPEVLDAGNCTVGAGEFEFVEMGNSVVSDFNLVCEASIFVPMLGTCFFLGCLCGASALGSLADLRGRRRAYIWAVAAIQFGTFLCACAPSYFTLALARFVAGIGVGGLGLVSYVWNAEVLPPDVRSILLLTTNCSWVIGVVALSPAAFLVRRWRRLLMLLLASGMPLWMWYPWLLESPKWLATKSRADEALEVLAQIAKANGRPPLPPPCGADQAAAGQLPRLGLDQVSPGEDREAPSAAADAGVLYQLLVDRRLARRFYVMCLAWFAISLGYYGLSMNVGQFGTSVYMSSMLASLVEIPAYGLAYLASDSAWTGRRGSVMGGLVIGGVCCLWSGLVLGRRNDKPGPALLAVIYAGKCAVALAFATLYLYATELFPTTVRSRSMAMQSFVGKCGGMGAPLVADLARYSRELPMLAFGAPCLLAGLLMASLPESRGKPMLDTIDDVPMPSARKACVPCLKSYRPLDEEEAKEPSCSPPPVAIGSAF